MQKITAVVQGHDNHDKAADSVDGLDTFHWFGFGYGNQRSGNLRIQH